MPIYVSWLLLLAMCTGPSDPKCQDSYFEDVYEYTETRCNIIFKDEVKCKQLAENRIKELKKNCSK